MEGFCYVYILESVSVPGQRYVGFTTNLRQRLKAHNAGCVTHTSKYRPWEIKTALALRDRGRALDFERYLKTASGRAFARKRL